MIALSSWVAAPLSNYEDAVETSGVRSFSHREEHILEDGGELRLRWEVSADPNTILSLDTAHGDGVRLLACTKDSLSLRLPSTLLSKLPMWRHIVASQHFHRCGHLQGKPLYRRVLRFEAPTQQHVRGSLGAPDTVSITTQELASHSQVVPYCDFAFSYMPLQAKDPRTSYEATAPPPGPRHLGAKFDSGLASLSNDVESAYSQAEEPHNTFNFTPRASSTFGWNWNFEKNKTREAQYRYLFPGGRGYILFKDSYLKAHAGISLNFTSRFEGIGQAPHVQLTTHFEGTAKLNADITTLTDVRGSTSGDPLGRFHIPLLNNFTRESFDMAPVSFFLGNIPVSLEPGVSMGLDAYHLGQLRGSLRLGLEADLFVTGTAVFDSRDGVSANYTAEALNVEISPPTWLVFTKHFEVGAMLLPSIWVKGTIGDVRDMRVQANLRPYLNMTIVQQTPDAGDVTEERSLAMYPFRATGLPLGEAYAVEITANGIAKRTSTQMSTGVIEYVDHVQDFDFGPVSESRLRSMTVQIALFRHGEDQVAGRAVVVICKTLVDGACQPSLPQASLVLDGREVTVQLSVSWQDQPVEWLLSKVRNIGLTFPAIALTDAQAKALVTSAPDRVELRVLRNGRVYIAPMIVDESDPSAVLLASNTTYELGICFTDAWVAPASLPQLHLVASGRIVGSSDISAIPTDMKDIPEKALDEILQVGAAEQPGTSLPISLTFADPNSTSRTIGGGTMSAIMGDAVHTTSWVYPYQVETLASGERSNLVWTANVSTDATVHFELQALRIGDDGALEPVTSTVTDVPQKCTTYEAYEGLCTFGAVFQAPLELTSSRVAFKITWSYGGRFHIAVSSPVVYASPGDMQGAKNQDVIVSNFSTTPSHIDFNEKMQELAAHCSESPLKYQIGAGVLFEGTATNIRLPEELVALTGVSEIPDYSTGTRPLTATGVGHKLRDILPKGLCAGGDCNGELPGCPSQNPKPMVIPRIEFQISRRIRWSDSVPDYIRTLVAYGMAATPEIVEVAREETSTPQERNLSIKTIEESRRLLGAIAGQPYEQEEQESDRFSVRFTEPLPYKVDSDLIQALISRGAFRGIEDGREAELGTPVITGFALQHDQLLAAKQLYDSGIVAAAPTAVGMERQAPQLRRCSTQAAAAGAAIALAGVIATAFVVFRRARENQVAHGYAFAGTMIAKGPACDVA